MMTGHCFRRYVVFALVALVIPATQAWAHTRANEHEPHRVWRHHAVGLDASAIGRIYGDAVHRCSWIGSPAGGDEILWPLEFRVRFKPLRIIDHNGVVVATRGEWLKTTGGDISSKSPASCPHAGATWLPSRLEFWGHVRPNP